MPAFVSYLINKQGGGERIGVSIYLLKRALSSPIAAGSESRSPWPGRWTRDRWAAKLSDFFAQISYSTTGR